MLYSILGIPLFLIVLTDIGKVHRLLTDCIIIISFDFHRPHRTHRLYYNHFTLFSILLFSNRIWPYCSSYNRWTDSMYVILHHRNPIMSHCTHRLYYNHFTLFCVIVLTDCIIIILQVMATLLQLRQEVGLHVCCIQSSVSRYVSLY